MYKARDNESGEIVALKIVRLDEDDEVRSRLSRHHVHTDQNTHSSGCSECSPKRNMSAQGVEAQEYC